MNIEYAHYVDVKAISNDIEGSGQLQVRDIHYVSKEIRTAWEFCQLLDEKCIASRKGYSEWLRYAAQNRWIKDEI